MTIKGSYNKMRKFLAEDSLASWIVSIIIAFVIVKFVFFPLLSFTLGTTLPLVVVESGSMHHPGSFVGNVIGSSGNFNLWWNSQGQWYEAKSIGKENAENWPLITGLEQGDIVVVSGHGEAEVGDIIIFQAGQQHPVIHRIVSITEIDSGEKVYETKGDNNSGQLVFENNISEDAVIGKAVFKIPKLGWLKLGIVKLVERI